mmetsp:Transcript_1501/g.2202  ORF Transcript_1501/g.2202 Transcript_1501/m.2202 type:complete len:225 (-) Transcript_1501:124-798(-)
MEQMLVHPDSPFIIGVGLLYLRYAADPNVLWSYFKLVMDNETEIQVEQRRPPTTIAKFARSLLEPGNRQFPRVPARIDETIQKNLRVEEEKERRKERHLSRGNDRYFTRGAEVIGLYEDEENPIEWYNAIIMEVLPDFRYTVKYTEYGNVETIGLGEIDFPDKRTTVGNEEASKGHRKRDYHEADYQRGHGRSNDNGRRGYGRNSDGDSRKKYDRGYDDKRRRY